MSKRYYLVETPTGDPCLFYILKIIAVVAIAAIVASIIFPPLGAVILVLGVCWLMPGITRYAVSFAMFVVGGVTSSVFLIALFYKIPDFNIPDVARIILRVAVVILAIVIALRATYHLLVACIAPGAGVAAIAMALIKDAALSTPINIILAVVLPIVATVILLCVTCFWIQEGDHLNEELFFYPGKDGDRPGPLEWAFFILIAASYVYMVLSLFEVVPAIL